ncbi:DUF5702 domain-containing protein [Faecalimonas sp.]
MKKGEVTAFLSILFLLFLSLTAAIIESATVQVTKNKRRADATRAIESVFAEYQKDLLKEYDVFALDGTYESNSFTEKKLLDRFKFYGAGKGTYKIEKIQFLSDDLGRAFREQVIGYMRQKNGVDHMQELAGGTTEWIDQEREQGKYEKEGKKVTESLEKSLAEAEQELPAEDNPLELFSEIKAKGILCMVVPKELKISEKMIQLKEMPSNRKLRKGRGTFKTQKVKRDTISKLYFTSYLLEKFSSIDNPDEKKKLSYELEYIIGGRKSDRENLDIVVTKLVGMRFPVNYGFLLSNSVKKAEAEAMAATLAGVIALPALIGVIKQTILLAWAFGESIIEVRALLEGEKVELLKNQENWKLQLSSLLKLGKEEINVQKSESGLSYREYLRMLLFLQKQEEITMRSLDVIEMNIRQKRGEFFRVDSCVSKLEIKSICTIREKITYRFSTLYGYQ